MDLFRLLPPDPNYMGGRGREGQVEEGVGRGGGGRGRGGGVREGEEEGMAMGEVINIKHLPALVNEMADGNGPRVRHKLSVFRPELIETFVK